MVNELTLSVFGKQTLNKVSKVSDILSMLSEMNLINIGELAEIAVANKVNTKQASRCTEGYDLENGWEIKHGQNYGKPDSDLRYAYISGFKNKTTDLRTIITETLTGKLYFFKIPYSYYKRVRGMTIAFPFNYRGRPYISGRSRVYDSIWKYEVKTFEELCS